MKSQIRQTGWFLCFVGMVFLIPYLPYKKHISIPLEHRNFQVDSFNHLQTNSRETGYFTTQANEDVDGDDDDDDDVDDNYDNSDDNCVLDRRFMPKGSMPLILLLSFPGSGNTWVRYLLERSSGIYTGSAYRDVGTGNDEHSTFRESRPCSKSTLVVKTHGWELYDGNIFKPRKKLCKYDGVIILVRNPYFAILAEFNRQKSNKTGTAPASAFGGEMWYNFAKTRAVRWANIFNGTVKENKNRMIIFYEQLVTDTDYQLRRMLDFLHIPQNETRMKCLLHNSSGHFKRKHKDFGFNPFTTEINRTIDDSIRKVRNILKTVYGNNLPQYESEYEDKV
ncbi:WSCD family member CG9164-like isoform X2 [Apostichopus japonicus]|uniref:WSCD family member CG9164-like isoform X2 n=1 Tax=Stichopus japonicus TaxID=307972 RepID=UPI003AB1E4A4